MKKLLSLVALMGLFTFVGCGGTPEASTDTPDQEAGAAEDADGSATKAEGEGEGSGTTEEN